MYTVNTHATRIRWESSEHYSEEHEANVVEPQTFENRAELFRYLEREGFQANSERDMTGWLTAEPIQNRAFFERGIEETRSAHVSGPMPFEFVNRSFRAWLKIRNRRRLVA